MQCREPVAHAEQPQMGLEIRRQATTVVLDAKPRPARLLLQHQHDALGGGMANRVRERLLRHAEQGETHLGRAGHRLIKRAVDRQPRLLSEFRDEPLQRRDQSQLLQRTRAEQFAQVAHLPERIGHQRTGFAAAIQIEPDLGSRERLPHAIVKFASDATTFLLLHAQELLRQLFQLFGSPHQRGMLFVHHQCQRPHGHGHDAGHIHEHAVVQPGTARAQQRIVQMVQAPQREAPSQDGVAGGMLSAQPAPEDRTRAQRDERQQYRRGRPAQAHVVNAEHRERRPHDGRCHETQVASAPPSRGRELQRGPAEQQCRAKGDHLMQEQPEFAAVHQIRRDRGQSHGVERPRSTPTGVEALATLPPKAQMHGGQCQRDEPLE